MVEYRVDLAIGMGKPSELLTKRSDFGRLLIRDMSFELKGRIKLCVFATVASVLTLITSLLVSRWFTAFSTEWFEDSFAISGSLILQDEERGGGLGGGLSTDLSVGLSPALAAEIDSWDSSEEKRESRIKWIAG